MQFEQTKWVWMNGEIIRWNDANTHVSAHGLHYGSGVFEGIRCYATERGPAIFQLDAHLDRLYYSAAVFGIEIPYSRQDIEQAICQTIRMNRFENCYIRPICYYASGSLALHPRDCSVDLAILTWPWAIYLDLEGKNRGMRITVSRWVKPHPRMIPTAAKICGAYINSILAARDAVSRGYDEALLFDAEDNIAEGPVENIFIIRNNRVLTNDERAFILPGITRSCVMRIAADLGFEVEVVRLKLEDIVSADEAFFTGTAAEIAPISEIDGKLIGEGKPGRITVAIRRAFDAITAGRDQRYESWLRYIET